MFDHSVSGYLLGLPVPHVNLADPHALGKLMEDADTSSQSAVMGAALISHDIVLKLTRASLPRERQPLAPSPAYGIAQTPATAARKILSRPPGPSAGREVAPPILPTLVFAIAIRSSHDDRS